MTTKKQLTPEQIAVLNLMVNGASSPIAIHAIGDRVAKGIHKVADATQFATDKTAYAAGTAQICAIPAAKHVLDRHRRPLRQEGGRHACLPLGLLKAKQGLGTDWQQEAHALSLCIETQTDLNTHLANPRGGGKEMYVYRHHNDERNQRSELLTRSQVAGVGCAKQNGIPHCLRREERTEASGDSSSL